MQKKDLQFIFFGTPDVASQTLTLLEEAGYIPSCIVTSPDRPAGRGMQMAQTPTALWALTHAVPCLKPEKITAEFINELKAYNADMCIVVAYGKILPQALIDMPPLGTFNIHYSLLPTYRGASPVEQALLSGDEVTGITIQHMTLKLDSGPIIAQKSEPIILEDTKESLRQRLIKIGADVFIDILPRIQNHEITARIQDETLATHCAKIKKEDGEIDPNGDPWKNYNKYRAFQGWPGVYFFIEKNSKKTRIKITSASYKDNSFIIERVIPEGKKEITYEDYVRSNTSK